jgi:hypothetical protein
MFSSHHGAVYCSDACRYRLHLKVRHCKACGQGFISYSRRVYCSDECRHGAPAPAVYRFVCPDRRSYVGSTVDWRNRTDNGLRRSNTRLIAAFEQYPPETFVFEILEHLAPRRSERELRDAEQRHIDALRSWDPQYGFNVVPAISETASMEHRTYYAAELKRRQAQGADAVVADAVARAAGAP